MRIKQKKLDKDYLLKNSTTAEIKKTLNKIINKETNKSLTRMNTDLVTDCLDWLLELDGITIDDNQLKILREKINQRIILKYKTMTP
jgi:YesN/AraC family two-component response regulator